MANKILAEELIACIDRGMVPAEIAKELNQPYNTVQYYLRKYGLEPVRAYDVARRHLSVAESYGGGIRGANDRKIKQYEDLEKVTRMLLKLQAAQRQILKKLGNEGEEADG